MLIIGFVVCVGLVSVFVLASKKTYTAQTSVMEHTDVKTVLYPTQTVIAGTQEAQLRMANLASIARSYAVLTRSAYILSSLGFKTDYGTLLDNAEIKPREDAELIDIRVSAPDPDEAVSTANVIAGEFAKFYNELMHGPNVESRKFIESQIPNAKNELNQAQHALRDFKDRNQITNLDGQTQQLLSKQNAMQQALASAEVAENDSGARLKVLEKQLPTLQPWMKAASTVRENPVWEQMATSLAAAETDLAGQLQTRGPNHPAVIAAQKRIAELKAKAAQESKRIVSDETKSTNPVYNVVLQGYMQTRAEHLGDEAKRKALTKVVADVQPELNNLPSKEMDLARLSLDLNTKADTYKLLQTKLDEAKLREQEASSQSSIKVIDQAFVLPNRERKALKIALAMIFAPLFSAGLVFLLNYLDNSLKTPSEAEALLGLPVVAVVPLVKSHSLAGQRNPKALQTFYQMLSLDLSCPGAKLTNQSVVVASAEPDVGRSTTAANLAISLAKDGARVILVDADLRQPTQHTMFGVKSLKGLTNILEGECTLEDVVTPTQTSGLLLLPAGAATDNPVRLLRSERMAEFIRATNDVADFVIYDTPAGITFADASIVVSYAKNVLLVHAAGRVSRGAEARFSQRLAQVGANFVGVVLNKVRPEDSDAYYHYRRSYSGPPSRNGNGKRLPGSNAAIQGSAEEDTTLTHN